MVLHCPGALLHFTANYFSNSICKGSFPSLQCPSQTERKYHAEKNQLTYFLMLLRLIATHISSGKLWTLEALWIMETKVGPWMNWCSFPRLKFCLNRKYHYYLPMQGRNSSQFLISIMLQLLLVVVPKRHDPSASFSITFLERAVPQMLHWKGRLSLTHPLKSICCILAEQSLFIFMYHDVISSYYLISGLLGLISVNPLQI